MGAAYPRIAVLTTLILLLCGILLGTSVQLRSVRNQLDRLAMVEKRSLTLLANSAADAGVIAMQRGQMKKANELFEVCLRSGPANPDQLRLDYIESLFATNQFDRAADELNKIDVAKLDGAGVAKRQMWQAILAMNAKDNFDTRFSEPIRLFRSAQASQQLNLADRFYVDAMLADTTSEAIGLLNKSLVQNPLSYKSRRLLILLQISLGHLTDAIDEINLAKQLFPDDRDFGLLDCMSLATNGELEDANSLLAQLDLGDNLPDWMTGLEFIEFVSFEISHRQEPLRLELDDETAQLIGERFKQELKPLLAKNGFQFPPRIALRFGDFYQALEDAAATSEQESTYKKLESLVKAHPESSLQVALAAHYMETSQSLEDLEHAHQLMKQASLYQGVINHSLEMAVESRVVLSLVLVFRSASLVPDKYHRMLVEDLEEMEDFPNLIDKYSTVENISKLLGPVVEATKAGHCPVETALRWIDRYDQNDDSSIYIGIWLRTVVHIHAENWVTVLALCEAQIQMEPHPDQNLEQIRDAIKFARANITKQTGEKFTERKELETGAKPNNSDKKD